MTAKAINDQRADQALTGILIVQLVTLFVALPLGALKPSGRVLLDLCHIAFALLCTRLLTRHLAVRAALFAGVVLLAIGPATSGWTEAALGTRAFLIEDFIAGTAFGFNALVTWLVARRIFTSGTVSSRTIQGAVLLYLSVANLFAILFGMVESHLPGAFAQAGGPALGLQRGMRTSALSFFSLTTITTTGYGDIVPVHPLARSLANLEAVFGQLYPATLLARLVGLHLLSSKKTRIEINCQQ